MDKSLREDIRVPIDSWGAIDDQNLLFHRFLFVATTSQGAPAERSEDRVPPRVGNPFLKPAYICKSPVDYTFVLR